MKNLYFTLILAICGFSSFAQLPNGSMSPDFTLSDFQTGETFNLYSLLDEGKSVILDFSATWCPPCWSYHNNHILADMYDEYGPDATDEVMVFFMEADPNTNDACLVGNTTDCNNSTMGDWTDGTPYPIFNTDGPAIRNAFQISYWPTLYAVAPNGQIFEAGQASKSTWESFIFTSFTLEASYTAEDALCVGTNGGNIYIETTSGFGAKTFAWSNGATTQDLINVDPGTYTCTITEGRGYRIVTDPITIEGPDEALTSIVTSNDILCNGDNTGFASISANGGTGDYSYAWSTGSNLPTIENLAGGIYSATVTDDNGCESIQEITIDEPTELSQLNQVMPATCSEDNGLIQIYANGGSGPYQYSNGVTTNNTGIFSDLPGGIYNASIIDFNGCSLNFDIALTQFDAPIAEASADESINCNNLVVSLSGEGSSVGSNIEYNWTTDDGEIIDGETTLTPTVGSAGTYTIEVWDQSQNCYEYASVVVEETNDAPDADAGESQTIDCTVDEVVLDGSNSTSGDNITYLWTTTDGNIIEGSTTATPTVNAGGTYQIEVTNTENGCTSIATVVVEQSASLPTADAGEESALTCVQGEIILDGTGSTTEDGIQYTWTTENGNIVSGDNTLNPLVNAPGVYLLEVLDLATGCVAYSSVEVIENIDPPVGNIDQNAVLTCTETSLDVTLVLEEGDFEITWTTVDGSILSGNNSDVVTIDEPGTYEVLFTDLNTGCQGSTSVIVEENINTPVAAFESENSDETVTFTDQSIGNPMTYVWDFGDGNMSTEANPVHEYAGNGDYNVCLTITNECGENTTCTTVTVLAGSSLGFAQDWTNLTCNGVCDGSSSLVPAEAIENYSISTTGPDGYVSDEFELQDLCPGTYNFTLTNEIGETTNGSFEITEPAEIVVEESTITHVDCAGSENGSVELEIEGGTGTISVIWDDGTEGLIKENVAGGEHTATVTDENGCAKVFSFMVDEPSELNLDDKSITNIDDNNATGSIDITVSGGTPGYSFLWSHGAETEDVFDLGFGNYTVIVTDANGCSETYGPFTVQNLVSVYQIEDLKSFDLQPNPTNGEVQLEAEFDVFNKTQISVVNSIGQTVLSIEEEGRSITRSIDLTDFAAGLYFVRLAVEDAIVVKKVIKQ